MGIGRFFQQQNQCFARRLWLVLPLLLGACTSPNLTDFQRTMPGKWLNTNPEYSQTPQPWPLQAWWLNPNAPDVTLVALIQRLNSANLSLSQAQARLRAARADGRSGAYAPNLSAQSSATFSDYLTESQGNSQDNSETFNAKLDATWEVPLFGQLGASRRLTNAEKAFAEADLAAVRNSVIAEGVRLYTALRSSQQQAFFIGQSLTAQQVIVSLTAIKQDVGLIDEDDLRRARQTEANLRQTQAELINQITQNLWQITALAALTAPLPEWQKSASIPQLNPLNPATTPLDTLRQRPDVRQAEAQVQQAAARLNLAIADRLPSLTLSGNLSQISNLSGGGPAVTVSGLPTLNLPLLDWGQRRANVTKNRAQLDETIENYQAVMLSALADVETQLGTLRTNQTRLTQAQQRLSDTQRLLSNAQLRRGQGLISDLEVAGAVQDAATAHSELAQAQADLTTTIAALAKALGGGFDVSASTAISTMSAER
jgi:NodT family efflux transporter outer membrane factor (OMF) lipoprotein